jgi:hypothetical protein
MATLAGAGGDETLDLAAIAILFGVDELDDEMRAFLAAAEEEETGGERMPLGDVPLGSTLARDIRADNGTLLLAKGRLLNRSMLDRLGDLIGAHADLKQIWVVKPDAE